MPSGADSHGLGRWTAVAATAVALGLASSMFMGDSREPIPFERIPAAEHPLIVRGLNNRG